MRFPDYINVKEFGARGDGVVNDQPAIQAAIDYIMANNRVTRKLYFPPGDYKIDAPLMVYKWNGTNYEFCTIEMHGNRTSSFSGSWMTTNIIANFKDDFAIGIQGGKNCLIEGLAITGKFNPTYGTYKAFVDDAKNYATFGASQLCRDSRYSPYAGVVIDPFCPVAPPDGGYPGMTSWYRGAVGAAGSAININACRINGFVVCVMYTPNNLTLNDESCNITNSTIEWCKTAVAYGQDQTKQSSIRNCICWSPTHTFIDNISYGQATGCPANVDGLCIAGHVFRMANLDTGGRVGTAFRNIFAEGLFMVGNIRGAPSTLDSSTFDFSTAIYPGIGSPDLYMNLWNVHVSGTQFRNYDNLWNKRIPISARNTTFANTHWDLPPLILNNPPLADERQTVFINSSYGNGYLGSIGQDNYRPSTTFGNFHPIALYGKFKVEMTAPSAYGHYELNYDEATFQGEIVLGFPVVVTVNDTLKTATFVIADATLFSHININDTIRGTGGATAFIGRVTALDSGTGTVTVSEVPANLSTTSFSAVYLNYVRYTGHPFIGDCTSGSPVITNVLAPFNYPVVGERIESRFFGNLTTYLPDGIGPRIIAVDSGAKTVTMNVNANATVAGANFMMGRPSFKIRKFLDIASGSFNTQAVFKGTEWYYDSAGAGQYTIKKYIIERGGLISGTPQAEWYEELDMKSNAGVIEYFDKATQAWIPVVTPSTEPLRYAVKIGQTGVADPTILETKENTLGEVPVLDRPNTGEYTITVVNPIFTDANTFIIGPFCKVSAVPVVFQVTNNFGDTSITIAVFDTSGAPVDLEGEMFLIIEVG